jgi:hypothetical protein
MNSKFTPLDCDDDVILLERDTFTVGRFKELCLQAIRKRLNSFIYNKSNSKQRDFSVSGVFSDLILGEENINYHEIKLVSIKNSQLLKVGCKGWQQGKLKINICISHSNENLDKVCLKFCPDELIEPESPLDDIRKLVEQK